MRITVAGVGYVGLSLAALLAQNHEVTAVTTTPAKADMINQFVSPIQDPEINRFFAEARSGERRLRLHATTDREAAYTAADIVIIAAPTNYNDEDDSFDTTAVEDVIERTLAVNPDALIVIKSTIPVGYTEEVQARYGFDRIIFSPEFLRESMALHDNLFPSRIIVGANESQKDDAVMVADLLAEGVHTEDDRAGRDRQDIRILITHPKEAEAIKLFANTYLANRISFFNELDTFAQIKGLDSGQIIEGVCLDPRIGDYYNNPSFGYGGYCFPKDTKQLLSMYRNIPQSLIESTVRSNEVRKKYIADHIISMHPEMAGIYRLIMKSNSDNFRSSAIQDVMRHLRDAGIPMIIYEPTIEDGSEFHGCTVVNSLEEFKKRSDMIIANRVDEEDLGDVEYKVYTRDIFRRD